MKILKKVFFCFMGSTLLLIGQSQTSLGEKLRGGGVSVAEVLRSLDQARTREENENVEEDLEALDS